MSTTSPTAALETTDPAAIAHSDAMRLPTKDVATQLQDGLGQKMVAHMTGKKNPQTVATWATGTKPHAATEQLLRDILQIFLLLRTVDSVHTTRAWFVGKNPNLQYKAPALAIAEGHVDDALAAAKAFVNS